MNLIAFSRALAYQFSADTVHGLDVLLLDSFNRHKTHARLTHRFTNDFGIVGAVLVALM
jgi:hypothetical protein